MIYENFSAAMTTEIFFKEMLSKKCGYIGLKYLPIWYNKKGF